MKYVFASGEWLAALHGVLAERAAQESANRPLEGSVCEVFTDAPAELAGPGRRIAWWCEVVGSEVRFGLEERDDVDFKAVGDYEAILPLARFDTGGDPVRQAQLAAMAVALVKSGKLTTSGERGPDSVSSAHDAIARLTA